ncbi:MAG: hypothetical protein KIT31_42620, partial [Deltaproteobacteria bacterium]|nr:hypothetical protein [Deltaproteobacteria bacterium]
MDDPHGYLAAFAERMGNIGVDEPRDDLAWLAITQGLTARGTAIELDWKHEAADALGHLERLAGRAGKKALAACRADPELEERPTYEALELFGKTLGGAQRALLHLDKQSDSYVLVVVDAHAVANLVGLAKKAGGTIQHLDGGGLAAEEAKRRKSSAKQARARASVNRWTQLLLTTVENTTDDALWTLRHHPYPLEAIRAAMPDAPARDRPLVEMVVAVHDKPASAVARATKDPALCLRALNYLGNEDVHGAERLAA